MNERERLRIHASSVNVARHMLALWAAGVSLYEASIVSSLARSQESFSPQDAVFLAGFVMAPNIITTSVAFYFNALYKDLKKRYELTPEPLELFPTKKSS